MRLKIFFPVLTILLSLLSLEVRAQAPKWENPEWENPEIFEINREAPTASFYRYPDAENALQNSSWEKSPYYQSLNGEWDFKYVESVPQRPVTFYETDFDTSG